MNNIQYYIDELTAPEVEEEEQDSPRTAWNKHHAIQQHIERLRGVHAEYIADRRRSDAMAIDRIIEELKGLLVRMLRQGSESVSWHDIKWIIAPGEKR